MATTTITSAWRPEERLTPWFVFDLDRLAWVEQRAAELTDDERRLVRESCERMLRATTPER
ncbi:MAG TPA: hypothetical protein VIM19_07230 [Actinomycetes bacterium]